MALTDRRSIDVRVPALAFRLEQLLVFRYTVLGEGHTQSWVEFEMLKVTREP